MKIIEKKIILYILLNKILNDIQINMSQFKRLFSTDIEIKLPGIIFFSNDQFENVKQLVLFKKLLK